MSADQTQADRICAKCGTALGAFAPDGLCAGCLLATGLELADAPVESKESLLKTPGSPGRRFGDYELLEEIARGGMGVVYKARQLSLNRIVAIKMIRASHLASEADLARFRQEAQTVASLRHPNIVAVHEVGEHDGDPYFSMDFVEGKNLAQLVHDNPLPARRAAAYLKIIAEAVHYAHQHGVLHRDLKPSNVLIDSSDHPRVTDFGLAKQLKSDSDLTLTGQVLGSPNFMPPEQAAGRHREMTPASDVYTLGALLYHMVTGRPPFVAESVPEILRLVAETEPVPPRLLVSTIPRDLETLCLKCLEKDPARRYLTAQELADELGLFLRDEPIRARPVAPAEKFARWCRGHPAIASLTALVGLLLMAIAIVSTMSAVRLGRANQVAREKLWDSYLAQARANRFSGRPGRRFDSLEALRKAAEIHPSLELRNEAIASMALVDLRPVKEWETRDGVPFVFDDNYECYATTDHKGNVVARRVADDHELMSFPGVEAPVDALAFSPNAHFLAMRFGAGNFTTRAYDLLTGAKVIEFTNAPAAFCYSPDSRSLVIAQRRTNTTWTLLTHDLQTGGEITSVLPGSAPESMKFSPTGDRLALASSNQVQILDARTGAIVQRLDHRKAVNSFDWHPQGDRLAVASHDRLVHIWEFSQREQRKVELNHGDVAILAFYNHQGTSLASIGWNNLLRFWNPSTGRELLSTAALGVRGSPFSTNDRRIAYWPTGHRVRLSEVAPGLECRAFCFGDTVHGAFICDFSPDGQLPALVLRLHLRLWDEASHRDIARVPEEGVVAAIYGLPDKDLFTAGANGLKCWPLEFRREGNSANLQVGPPEAFGPPGPIRDLWKVHNGQRLAVLKDGTLHILDLRTRRELKQVQLNSQRQSAAISQNGKWLVTSRFNGETVQVWDIENGRPTVELPAPPSYPPISYPLAFTSDSRLLVTGSREGYTAWHCDSWKPAYSIRRPDTGGTGGRIAFSASGTMGAVADGPDSIRLFDPVTGREFATFEPAEPSVIVGLIFSPDGGQLIANTVGSGMHYWDLRLVRKQLAAIKLDWDSPALPPPSTRPPPGSLQITFLPVAN